MNKHNNYRIKLLSIKIGQQCHRNKNHTVVLLTWKHLSKSVLEFVPGAFTSFVWVFQTMWILLEEREVKFIAYIGKRT